MILEKVRTWVQSVVIEWNLCPFARKEFVTDSIRYFLSEAETEADLLFDLAHELEYLSAHPKTETTLLVHPRVLTDFEDYNQFLELADGLLEQMSLVGVYQLATFHPDYQFAETERSDPENYTNRAPYPLLHILREQSMTRAVDAHPNAEQIPEDNIKRMNTIGAEALADRWHKLFGN